MQQRSAVVLLVDIQSVEVAVVLAVVARCTQKEGSRMLLQAQIRRIPSVRVLFSGGTSYKKLSTFTAVKKT
jgi:hypothetical protein